MMILTIENEFKGVEHLIGGFYGLKWNGKEWVEKSKKISFDQ